MFARRPMWLKRTALSLFATTTSRKRERRTALSLAHASGSYQSILLTFDDGPHPEYTPAVLERLRRFNLPAAFFLVGNRIDAAPHLPTQIASAGHAVGNHTDSHRRFGWCDIALPLADMKRCQERIQDAKLFRPPFGRLTPGVLLAARNLGLSCMNWSLDSGDWKCRSNSDAAACARQVLDHVRPGDIVLFHDNHQWIGPILDAVLPEIVERMNSGSHRSSTTC